MDTSPRREARKTFIHLPTLHMENTESDSEREERLAPVAKGMEVSVPVSVKAAGKSRAKHSLSSYSQPRFLTESEGDSLDVSLPKVPSLPLSVDCSTTTRCENIEIAVMSQKTSRGLSPRREGIAQSLFLRVAKRDFSLRRKKCDYFPLLSWRKTHAHSSKPSSNWEIPLLDLLKDSPQKQHRPLPASHYLYRSKLQRDPSLRKSPVGGYEYVKDRPALRRRRTPRSEYAQAGKL